jgi:tetratricopeptide (TPR) repeat protein
MFRLKNKTKFLLCWGLFQPMILGVLLVGLVALGGVAEAASAKSRAKTPTSAAASQPAGEAVDARREYQACMELVQLDPERALESAGYWIEQGGNLAARHCRAAALQALGRHQAAAVELTKLANELTQKLPKLAEADRSAMQARVANLWMQAGQAWWLDSDNAQALAAFDRSLAQKPDQLDAQLGRGMALGALGQWVESKNQLDQTIAGFPEAEEAWIRRAQVQRLLMQLDGAMADITHALNLHAEDSEVLPEILLERGLILAAQGKKDAAAADWVAVKAKLGVEDPIGQQAATQLEQLGGQGR